MKQMKFKTTIKCSGCVEAVTPVLDEQVGQGNWEVDLKDPQRVLSVKGDADLDEKDIIEKIGSKGYKAERIADAAGE